MTTPTARLKKRWGLAAVFSFGCLAAFIPHGSNAQAPGPAKTLSSADEIVITGEAERQDRKARARALIDDLGLLPGVKPLSRWARPVCPVALGMSEDEAALVVARVREVAAEIGADVADADCRPNFQIAVAANTGSLFRKVSERRSTAVRDLPRDIRE
ncbi:MAG: hypothetical protein WA906_08245, partial [Pacificimonas sp.]